jgi:hypothetical protein
MVGFSKRETHCSFQQENEGATDKYKEIHERQKRGIDLGILIHALESFSVQLNATENSTEVLKKNTIPP